MNCPMSNGSSSGRCCPCRRVGASGWTTAGSSTGSCGSSVQARPGGTCPSGTGRRPRCTRVFAGGRWTARSSGCSAPPRSGRTPPGTSTGWCRNSTIVRAHQHAAVAREGGPQPGARTLPRRPDQQDSPGLRRRRPPARLHRHGRQDQRLHPVHRRDGGDPGAQDRSGTAPGAAPSHVLGDKGYSSRAIRSWLRRRGISHTIPERADQVCNRLNRGSHGGRPPAFDRDAYMRRNVVERCFNKLKQWCGIATGPTRPPSPTKQQSPSQPC